MDDRSGKQQGTAFGRAFTRRPMEWVAAAAYVVLEAGTLVLDTLLILLSSLAILIRTAHDDRPTARRRT